MSQRRYPLEPLAQAMGSSVHAMAEALGLSGSWLRKIRDNGVPARSADRLAVAAGFHPYEVWPEMHAHALEETVDWPDIDETPDEARRRILNERARAQRAKRRAA